MTRGFALVMDFEVDALGRLGALGLRTCLGMQPRSI